MKNKLPTIRQVSAGVIVTSQRDGSLKILLLEQNNKRYNRRGKMGRRKVIDIGPGGKVEQGETLLETAKRELKQETNLDITVQEGFKASYNYYFDVIANEGKFKGQKVHVFKTRIYFLASASPEELKKLKLSDEHIAYEFLTIKEALNSKDIMKPQKALLQKLEKAIEQYGNSAFSD